MATRGGKNTSQLPTPRAEAAGVSAGARGKEAVPKLQKARAWTQGRNASGGGQGKSTGSLLGGSELDRFLLLRGIGKDVPALRAGAWNMYIDVKIMYRYLCVAHTCLYHMQMLRGEVFGRPTK